MSQYIGYVGKVDGKQVFFTGDVYYANVNGKAFVLDWDKIESSRKELL